MKRLYAMLVIIIFGVLLALLLPLRAKNKTYTEYQTKSAGTPTVTREMVIAEIKAQALIYNVNPTDALRVLECESNLNPRAKNPNSTAFGIPQFLNKTWEYIGGGDRGDYKEQIIQFMKWWPSHRSWWQCK